MRGLFPEKLNSLVDFFFSTDICIHLAQSADSLDAHSSRHKDNISDLIYRDVVRRPDKAASDADVQLLPQDLVFRPPEPRGWRARRGLLHRQLHIRQSPTGGVSGRDALCVCRPRIRTSLEHWLRRRKKLGVCGGGSDGESAGLGDRGNVHVQPLAGEEGEEFLVLLT